MQARSATMRVVVAMGTASFLAGCVQPGYVQPGPIQLQPYPPPVIYQSTPDYRAPIPGSGPIPLQAAPLVQPLPPPSPLPSVTEVPADDAGPIPVQDMPALAPDAAPPAVEAAPAPAPAAPEVIRKIPTSGPGSNVPLEGFRPMKGQTRPTP